MKTQRLARIALFAGVIYITIGIVLILAFWPLANAVTAAFSLMAFGVNLLSAGANVLYIERWKAMQNISAIGRNELEQGRLKWIQTQAGLWVTASANNTHALIRQLDGEAPNWEYSIIRFYMSPWWRIWERYVMQRTLLEGRAFSRENALLIVEKAVA